jgi:hypothetical protein
MVNRCHNTNAHAFEHYGGRGISVCDRWRESYDNFLTDMGRKPSARHSIDRIDVNGVYEPSNCRWATYKVQARNTRVRKDNTSGHRGVSWSKSRGKYVAYIAVNSRTIELGGFDKIEDAIRARADGELKYWADTISS